MSDGPQRFSEQEVALILRRAGDLAEQEPADSRKMSLAELEQVAEEAGIDRALVRRAAAEVLVRDPAPPQRSMLLGGPTRVVLEAVLLGELEASGHENIIELLRRRLGEYGRHDVLGRTLSWTSRGANVRHPASRNIVVSVRVHSGSTYIRVEEHLRQLAGGLFGGLLGGLGGGGSSLAIMPAVALGLPILVPLFLAGWFGSIYGLTRTIYRHQSAKRELQLRELLRELTTVVEDAVARAPG